MAEVRQFDSGATRDTDDGKLDFEGFISPTALLRFGEYMHENRTMRDGTLRDSDNWQQGIPDQAYMKSMWRHFHDVWLHHRGHSALAREDKQRSLCAILFNAFGMLHEELRRESL